MSTYRLLMLPPQDEVTLRWAGNIAADVPEATVEVAEDEAQAKSLIAGADAAYGTLTGGLLSAADRLRWLQAPAAAPPAGYFFPELVAHRVVVTNFRGIYSDHVGTHAMAFVVALARGMQRYLPAQHEGRWEPDYREQSVIHLPEATMLIIGLGGIGAEIARLAKAFGITVLATDARLTEAPDDVDELAGPDRLDVLLPRADIVVLTVPHTPETEGLIDARRLGLMKRTAILVNIGRGMTVRLDDLIEALRSGAIAGAGLDVFEVEPLPRDHPLWTTPNVLITPHTAVAGPYIEERRYSIFAENARRFSRGDDLVNVVDKARWF